MGTLNCVCFVIEINNKQTFWSSFTEVVLLLMGQILKMVEIELKYDFPLLNKLHKIINFTFFAYFTCYALYNMNIAIFLQVLY